MRIQNQDGNRRLFALQSPQTGLHVTAATQTYVVRKFPVLPATSFRQWPMERALKSSSASRCTGTYNHPPQPAATAPPTADPSIPISLPPCPRPSENPPGTPH